MDENIKEAFLKVKQDMDMIKYNLSLIAENTLEHRQRLNEFSGVLNLMNNYLTHLTNSYLKLKENSKKVEILQESTINNKEQENPTNQHINPTNQHINPTNQHINPTDNDPIKPLKEENIVFSTGNEGVPTDKQTNQQTNQQTQNTLKNTQNTPNSISNAIELLSSLDSVKKEIRLQFKRLTDQEMAVFSAMYQIDEEKGYSDYKLLSDKLNLSESSIREYVGKLTKKGIPVEKYKINNKSIQLKISQNLKKIANLSFIMQLRDS